MRLVIDLTLPTDARLVPRTRRVFSGYLSELGVDNEITDDVILALDEACANVIRHAFPGRSDECFRLVFELSPDQVLVVVEDDGVGFAADSVAADSVGHQADAGEEAAVSGRGLKIIRQLMTSVDIESAGTGTRLRMRKDLASSGSPPLVTGAS